MNTVLVIDDDFDTCDVLSRNLTAFGWSVQSVDCLIGGLNLLAQTPNTQCLLLDYNLPGMPMPVFLEKLAKLCPKIGIVLISATHLVAEKAKKYNMKYYMAKPIDFDALQKMLIECVADAAKK